MSNVVSWSLQMSVREGALNGAEVLVAEMIESAREEPGTITYEYFLSHDGGSCHIYERYLDSEAALAHLANFGANFAERFMTCFEPTSFSVYGPASDALRQALAPFGAVHLEFLGGFSR